MKRLITGITSISSFLFKTKSRFRYSGEVIFLVTVFIFTMVIGCENPIEKGGDEVMKAMERSQAVADSTTMKNLNAASQSYRGMNGKYPESIEELEQFAGQAIDREKFEYDPVTGKLSAK